MRCATALILVSALLSGCGTAPDADEARGAAEAFYAAIRDGRGGDACELLSEATIEALESQKASACREAITELDHQGGTVTNVHVFITSAKVDLDTGESVFLGREPGGWKLSALACKVEDGKPRDRPLECEVEA